MSVFGAGFSSQSPAYSNISHSEDFLQKIINGYNESSEIIRSHRATNQTFRNIAFYFNLANESATNQVMNAYPDLYFQLIKVQIHILLSSLAMHEVGFVKGHSSAVCEFRMPTRRIEESDLQNITRIYNNLESCIAEPAMKGFFRIMFWVNNALRLFNAADLEGAKAQFEQGIIEAEMWLIYFEGCWEYAESAKKVRLAISRSREKVEEICRLLFRHHVSLAMPPLVAESRASSVTTHLDSEIDLWGDQVYLRGFPFEDSDDEFSLDKYEE